MALDSHQRHHVEAVLNDASEIIDGAERRRIQREAGELLQGITGWPDPDLQPTEIHAWIEDVNLPAPDGDPDSKPDDFRVEVQRQLAKRRLE